MFEQGKSIRLFLLIFGSSKMQPYLFAISRELPVQLSRLQAEWERFFGRGVNTRRLIAQDSEHFNNVFKDIESWISDHHVWTAAARRSQCTISHGAFGRVTPFVYERATKVEALRLGLLNKNAK